MPVSGNESLFANLFRWGKEKEENFCTKSLVFLLKRLHHHDIQQNSQLAAEFLNEIFGLKLSTDNLNLENHTHAKASRYIPDVIIYGRGFTHFIEVKVSSHLRSDQLREYRATLDQEGAKIRKLLLLTRLGNEDKQQLADLETSWVRVWQLLGEFEERVKPKDGDRGKAPEAYWLIRDFRNFLKEQGMGVENVTEIPSRSGLENLERLLSLILSACELNGLKVKEASFDDYWFGWWFKGDRKGGKNGQYSCGVYAENPSGIIFGFHKETYSRIRRQLRNLPTAESWSPTADGLECRNFPDKNDPALECRQPLPNDFASYPAERQLDTIRGIIEKALIFAGEPRANK